MVARKVGRRFRPARPPFRRWTVPGRWGHRLSDLTRNVAGVPEGDTIHRLAVRLGAVLTDQDLVRMELARSSRTGIRPPPTGTRIESVDAQGKHLLIRFANGVTLRTHLRMNGRWLVCPAGRPWPRPRHRMRAVVAVEGWEAVCFDAPVVELERRPATDHLGPDLADPEPDLAACLVRLATLIDRDTAVAEVLLDQRVACGVGNVYKSEVCYACGLDPRTPVGGLDQVARTDLLATAARLLRANLGPGPRTTVTGLGAAPSGPPTGALAVYGRAGRSCRRCGTRIQVARTGPYARSTYWCPTCQPPFHPASPTRPSGQPTGDDPGGRP
jgi:endonuclease VIII